MEARQVRHFLAAYEAGTFALAGERLNLSQQAVSKSILRLESQLGVRLFERDGRRLRPTDYAELFLPHARTIHAEADQFRANLSDMLGGRQGLVRIGVGPSAAADIVAGAMRILSRGRPELRARVMAGIYETMVEDLIRGRIDLFVSLRQVERHDPLIREEMVGELRYVVVAGASHALAGREKVSLAALSGERWVEGSNIGAVEQSIAASFGAAGVRQPVAEIETTSVLFTLAMLDGGEHLAILPEMLVARDLRAGRLVRLDIEAEPWVRPLIVATRVRSRQPPLVGGLVAALKTVMAAASESVAIVP